jgi:hypothetical protein
VAALIPEPRGTGVVENAVGYLIFSIQGFCIGFGFQSLIRRAIEGGGRRAWVLPVSLLALSCIWDACLSNWQEIRAFFWPGADGEQGLGWLLLTLPAVACSFYSLGILAASRTNRGAPPAPPGTRRRQ